MAFYYADSSALVKRHVAEIGSAWFTALADPAIHNTIVTAHVSLVELYSALNRRIREQTLTRADYAQIIPDLDLIFNSQYGIVPLSQTVINEAKGLFERHPLRAYDAVQLASAIYTQSGLHAAGASPLIFLSADGRLLTAAEAEGFVTDNPNLH
jgi:hypothetical protein